MLKKIKCSDCQNTFEVDLPSISSHFIFKKGKYFDKETGLELKPEILPSCPSCKSSNTIKLIDGTPRAQFPIDDLTFAISKKRFIEGLHSDVSSKAQKKMKAESAERSYHASSAPI